MAADRRVPAVLGIWVISLAPSVVSGAHGQAHLSPAAGRGKPIYESACAACHGSDGRGIPQSTLGFDIPVPDFTVCAFNSVEPDADWHAIIEHGGPVRGFDRRMPAYGGVLTRDQISDVLAYVRSMCPNRAWPRGDLNLPRPLRTEKAFPENEAVLTTTADTTGRGAVSNEFLYEQRLGARTQYEIKVPLLVRSTSGPSGWERGLGDVAAGLKRVLYHSHERGTIVSAGGEVIFPTGKEDRGLGAGTTVFEPFVTYGQILLSDSFVQMHAGVELPADREQASREAFWRVTAGRTFAQNGGVGRAWSPMLELLGARDFESGAVTRWDLVPQMQVTLNTRQHVMVNAGLQIPVNERRGRGTRVLFYFLWDWFDGGLLDGW